MSQQPQDTDQQQVRPTSLEPYRPPLQLQKSTDQLDNEHLENEPTEFSSESLEAVEKQEEAQAVEEIHKKAEVIEKKETERSPTEIAAEKAAAEAILGHKLIDESDIPIVQEAPIESVPEAHIVQEQIVQDASTSQNVPTDAPVPAPPLHPNEQPGPESEAAEPKALPERDAPPIHLAEDTASAPPPHETSHDLPSDTAALPPLHKATRSKPISKPEPLPEVIESVAAPADAPPVPLMSKETHTPKTDAELAAEIFPSVEEAEADAEEQKAKISITPSIVDPAPEVPSPVPLPDTVPDPIKKALEAQEAENQEEPAESPSFEPEPEKPPAHFPLLQKKKKAEEVEEPKKKYEMAPEKTQESAPINTSPAGVSAAAATISEPLTPGNYGWSWGAFMFDIAFVIAVKKYKMLPIFILYLIPWVNVVVMIIMRFYLGFKGREMAMESSMFENDNERLGFMRAIDHAGKVLFIVTTILLVALIPAAWYLFTNFISDEARTATWDASRSLPTQQDPIVQVVPPESESETE